MSARFAGRVALITGAATVIGRATAVQLAAEGASVVITTRQNQSGLTGTVKTITDQDGVAVGIRADAASPDDAARSVQTALDRFGRLDVLVNNAVYQQPRSPVETLELDIWDRSLAVGLTGVFLGSKEAIPAMLKTAGRGAIVNVSSINSTFHAPGLPAYSAAKGGVDALTRQMALEYGPRGIRVNAVNPGLIATEGVTAWLDSDPAEAAVASECYPLNRIGAPADVAALIAFLASDDAGFITGVTVPIDGGLSIQSAAALVRPGLRQGWRSGQFQFIPADAVDNAEEYTE